jgi:putative acetyltransferase
VQIRRFRDSDTAGLIALFKRSVLELGPKKYSVEAAREWAGGEKNVDGWRERMQQSETFVAEDENGELLGWIEFERDGHLDMLYCSPEAAGTGVAQQLYDVALKRAREMNIERFFAEASRFSEPFFLKNGWTIEFREALLRNGVEIPRARMAKNLD